jgi:hypothetical protein
MSIQYILIISLFSLLIGFLIGYFISKKYETPSTSPNALSDSLAKIILASINNQTSVEGFEDEQVTVQSISQLLSSGDFTSLETQLKDNLIDTSSLSSDLTQNAETIDPDLIPTTDPIKIIADTLQTDAELEKLNDELILLQDTVSDTSVELTDDEKTELNQQIEELQTSIEEKQTKKNEILGKLGIPLEQAIQNVPEDKVLHLQEIQNKILIKREKQKKKKFEKLEKKLGDKVKNSQNFKNKKETEINEKKNMLNDKIINSKNKKN